MWMPIWQVMAASRRSRAAFRKGGPGACRPETGCAIPAGGGIVDYFYHEFCPPRGRRAAGAAIAAVPAARVRPRRETPGRNQEPVVLTADKRCTGYRPQFYAREIAHLAARLMAVDGIEDHALAKRKAAARQACRTRASCQTTTRSTPR